MFIIIIHLNFYLKWTHIVKTAFYLYRLFSIFSNGQLKGMINKPINELMNLIIQMAICRICLIKVSNQTNF